jgi:hypothetical protein
MITSITEIRSRSIHPLKKEGKRGQLLNVAKIAVRHSGGRLRLACDGGDHFLKLDGERIGRDIEFYEDFGDTTQGWQVALLKFSSDIFMRVKAELPEKSHTEAGKALLLLGESVFPEDLIAHWKNIF